MRTLIKILKCLIVVVFTMQAFNLVAQNPRTHQKFNYNIRKIPTIGIKGGLLMSSISGDEALDKYAKKFGPQIGITSALYFSPQFSIRAELNYEWKGARFANQEMDMNLHYATLPLFLKFNFTPDPEIYIYGGGYASYLFMANTKGIYEIIIEDDFINESINEDILANLNTFDAGLVIGAGVQGRFNRRADIFLDLRYAYSFMNLDNGTAEKRYNFNYDDFWPEQEVESPKLKSFILTTGFVFYLDAR